MNILPVDRKFQPGKTNLVAPAHNADYGIEQDFHKWAKARPEEAEGWDYLPFYWNRAYVNWNWGQDGLGDIQREIERLVSRDRPTFTVCEYDVRDMQSFDLCGMVVMTASRRNESDDVDVPLLCSLHQKTGDHENKWKASFVGNLQTCGIRAEMQEVLDREDVHVEGGDRGTDYFVDLMLKSQIALAPRGHGGQSFRFYEAMQLGTVPMLIGEPDTRPFKDLIEWDDCSLYAARAEDIDIDVPDVVLTAMGQTAQVYYYDHLAYGQWCGNAVRCLPSL